MSHTEGKDVMEQAQVFASAWSLVGGQFDCGDGMERAEQAKAALKEMVSKLVAERDHFRQRCADLREGGVKIIEDHSQRTVEAMKIRAERDELVKALRKCQNALEPYDDIKPRNWITDREKLAAAHQDLKAILAKYPEAES